MTQLPTLRLLPNFKLKEICQILSQIYPLITCPWPSGQIQHEFGCLDNRSGNWAPQVWKTEVVLNQPIFEGGRLGFRQDERMTVSPTRVGCLTGLCQSSTGPRVDTTGSAQARRNTTVRENNTDDNVDLCCFSQRASIMEGHRFRSKVPSLQLFHCDKRKGLCGVTTDLQMKCRQTRTTRVRQIRSITDLLRTLLQDGLSDSTN